MLTHHNIESLRTSKVQDGKWVFLRWGIEKVNPARCVVLIQAPNGKTLLRTAAQKLHNDPGKHELLHESDEQFRTLTRNDHINVTRVLGATAIAPHNLCLETIVSGNMRLYEITVTVDFVPRDPFLNGIKVLEPNLLNIIE